MKLIKQKAISPKIFKSLLLSAIVGIGHNATAASFSFDTGPFSDNSASVHTFSDDDGLGLNVDVTTTTVDSLVAWRAQGLGVRQTSGINQGNLNGSETLVFSFDQAITLTGIEIRVWNAGSDALTFNANGTHIYLDTSGLSDGVYDYLFFPGPITTTAFSLTSDSNVGTNLRVSGLSGISIATVPLPATAWLFGAALLGLFGRGVQSK